MKETLEEAALRLYPKFMSDPYNPNGDLNKEERDIWIAGAKWMEERMYTEEEVLKIIRSHANFLVHGTKILTFKEWFEQFKKK